MELKSEHRKLAVALAIAMDRSGSMSVGIGGGKTKMDLADSGAANAIDLLEPMDQVTVFAIDSEATKTIPLTRIENKKAELGAKARKIRSSGGGIYVYVALKAAWEELKKSPAGTRHVILFSDANDSEEPGDYKNLIKEPIGAQATGRWAEISPKPTDWLKQVDGYNLSYAREDATVSLVSTDEYLAPLVAHARRGLGRSAAVSFPLGGEFSETARNWPGYGDFLQTLGRFLMGEDTPPGIALRHRLDGTRLTLDLLYDTAAWSQKLSAMPPKVRLRDDAGGATLDLPWRRIAPGHFFLTRDLDEGSVVRGAVQVGENALPFGPLSVGSSVEWAFEPERLAELRAVSNQTRGRELLDISKAWLRPPFVAETSLRLPLGIALVLLVLAEALLTRTGWKLPQLALPKRVPRAARVKLPQAKRTEKEIPLPTVQLDKDVQPLPATEASARSARFQRAKDKK